MKIITLLLTVIGAHAFAMDMKCRVSSSVDGAATVVKEIVLPLADGADRDTCLKQSNYTIPDTKVEVIVYGHGACNPNPDYCTLAEPTFGGIHIHDREGANYGHSYGSCSKKPVESGFQQMIINGKKKVNVVVGCALT